MNCSSQKSKPDSSTLPRPITKEQYCTSLILKLNDVNKINIYIIFLPMYRNTILMYPIPLYLKKNVGCIGH